MAHWEFIPFWTNDQGGPERAREKYATLDACGDPCSLRVCLPSLCQCRSLMLSSGFYEWRHYRGKTYPYFITVKGKDVFYIAAVWQPWTDRQSGEYLITFALVTTKANALMARVHNKRKRMPVILNDELAHEWKDRSLDIDRKKAIAIFQQGAEKMEAYSIRKDFCKVLDPKEAFEYEGLPPFKH